MVRTILSMLTPMAIIRVQAVFEHSGGLPRDNAVNTFHFDADADEATILGICNEVRDFYSVDVDAGGGASRSVGSFLSTFYTNLRIKAYDVTGPAPHPPLADLPAAFAVARNANINLPQEVALCLSFEGQPTGGLIQARRRGRIYIGPLNDSARVGGANAAARPSTLIRTTFLNAAAALATGIDAFGEWVVYSRPFAGRAADAERRADGTFLPALAARPGTAVDIDRVWVDDAFDTQRRRGERATGKGLVLSVD